MSLDISDVVSIFSKDDNDEDTTMSMKNVVADSRHFIITTSIYGINLRRLFVVTHGLIPTFY
jgi:hypothetical protein